MHSPIIGYVALLMNLLTMQLTMQGVGHIVKILMKNETNCLMHAEKCAQIRKQRGNRIVFKISEMHFKKYRL